MYASSMIKKAKIDQVIIVSPLGTITRVALCDLIVDKDAVVSIFNGDHFDSFVNE